MTYTRERTIVEIHAMHTGPMRRSQLIMDEVDYVGYYDLSKINSMDRKTGSIVYRVSDDTYAIVNYQSK